MEITVIFKPTPVEYHGAIINYCLISKCLTSKDKYCFALIY
jgi:hypothetical protein